MTDRELLELAAKAAGINGVWVEDYGSGDYYYQGESYGVHVENKDGSSVVWNPLTDDGDALRLAVKLWLIPNLQEIIERFIPEEDFDSDREAATRRAIVRAAAEIGRAMP